jgi:EAL domain-containing protein (putative c-di-GMP-specific phosphodiesterase class I)
LHDALQVVYRDEGRNSTLAPGQYNPLAPERKAIEQIGKMVAGQYCGDSFNWHLDLSPGA